MYGKTKRAAESFIRDRKVLETALILKKCIIPCMFKVFHEINQKSFFQ